MGIDADGPTICPELDVRLESIWQTSIAYSSVAISPATPSFAIPLRVQRSLSLVLWVCDTAEPIEAGMSGSRVVSQDSAAALGVLVAAPVEGEKFLPQCAPIRYYVTGDP
jgi:hypothetical protein